MRMRWMVAGRCVVLLNISGRCSATLTGRRAARAPSAASSASARRNSLPPKPPPMKGEIRRTFSFGMPSVLRQVAAAPVDHLVGGPHGELVAVPGGDRGVRLHHRVRLVGRGVGRVELDRRRGEGAGEVADRGVRRPAVCARACSPQSLAARSKAPLAARVLHLHQLRGGARLLEGLGDHQRDGLVVVLDLRAAEQLGGVELALAELAGVVAR